jgi:tetratricopeptide (TPR) repeat protein
MPTPASSAVGAAGRVALALLLASSAAVAQPAAPTAVPSPADALHGIAAARLASRTPEDLEAGLRLFAEAVELDPAHARAHAGLATAASLLALYSVAPASSSFATARIAAAEALRLDPTLPEAHAVAGLVAYLDAWDFAAAERRFTEALRLDPALADAWHWYGMMLYATSRFAESLQAYDRALELAPDSSLFQSKRAVVLAALGRRGDAERELRATLARFPGAAMPRRDLGYLLFADGRAEEGLVMLVWAAELSGGVSTDADLGWGFGRTQRRIEAEGILSHLERASTRSVHALDIALVNAGLERRDPAFRWLEDALSSRDPGLVYLATAPGWEPLRDDGRFEALLDRVGLRAARAAAGGARQ